MLYKNKISLMDELHALYLVAFSGSRDYFLMPCGLNFRKKLSEIPTLLSVAHIFSIRFYFGSKFAKNRYLVKELENKNKNYFTIKNTFLHNLIK